jgi:hypothetical protein
MVDGSTFCGGCGNRLGTPAPSYQAPARQGIQIDTDSRGQGRGYTYEVLHQPSFALAVLQLAAETVHSG